MSQRGPQLRVPVSLRRLFPQASFVGCADIRVSDATECSSQCSPKTLFAALPGTRVDGTQFIAEAVARGAGSLLVETPLAQATVPQCVVPGVRRAYAELCHALAGSPSRRLSLAGVTGTNGKTTVTWLIRSILHAAGSRAGLLGTIEYSDGVQTEKSHLTTPDSKTLAQWLARMVREGTTHAAMELSSHALDQDRAAGTQLDVAVVTNITHDHFDYHKTPEAYRQSKARIADLVSRDGRVVLNADDPGSLSVRDRVPEGRELMTYSLDGPADVTGKIVSETLAGSRFVLGIGRDCIEICTSLVGRHNIANCLAAAAAASKLGVSLEVIASGIESLGWVPGRLERVDLGQPYHAFVDYAHTDDALRRCVQFLKRLTRGRGRVFCVFGAGGDRDRTKRPLLGQAACEADVAVVTSDNPRSERPEQIIDDILGGMTDAPHAPHVEVDRAEAIRWALDNAAPGDSVLIAGKGHETEQIVGSERFPLDDREIVRDHLSPAYAHCHKERARMRA